MTLFRQINSLLFGLFLLVMCSLVYFQFTQTRDFMSQQMKSDLNNTSTSLTLMLKPHLETGDMVGAETLVNVIFEGGFYRKVTLTWLVDNKQQTWENPITIKGVPQWFIDLDLFGTQTHESLVTSGWMQLATLEVEGHPALGYQELWRVMNDTLMILSFLFIISIVILRIRLNYILKPLNQIAEHAREIAQQKFDKELVIPNTSELKDVVGAINTMSRQLNKFFNSLDNEVSQLKNQTLVDGVSGLPNRQYLSGQISSWLDEPGYGGLIIAKFDWLDHIHSKYGYQVRDETIKVLAQKMQQQLAPVSDSVVARIANTEFAFLIIKADRQQLEAYLQTLIRIINQEMSKAGSEPNSNYALGISERSPGLKLPDLLSQSDNALQHALKNNKISQWFDNNQPKKLNREQWRTRLVNAINRKQFVFQWQQVLMNNSRDVMQREMYCRLTIDDKIINAGQFMPFVELLSLGSQLDKCLLETIANSKILNMNYEPIAINLTHDSIRDDQFHQWLKSFLKQIMHVERIHFEIPESAITSNLKQCENLSEIIRDHGAKLGVDQCGRKLGSLGYLKKLRPHYVKLDQSFAYYDKTEHDVELCRALVNVAKGLDIKVIMTAIENDEQLSHFRKLNTDGYQGYICPPVDVVY